MKKYSLSKEAGAGAAAGATTLDSRKTSTASVSASAGREPEEKNCERPGEQGGVALDAIASEKAKATEVETAILQQISDLYEKLSKVREEGEAGAGTGGGGADRQRIILVSRRLPYKLQTTSSGRWKAEINNVDQALQNYRVVHGNMNCLWVGWPGTYVEPGRQNSLMEQLKEHRLVPIFLDPPMEDKFYEGFCKTILWPLFHSSMPTTEDTITSHDVDSDDKQREEGQLWMAYKFVNQSFADAVQDVYREGDLIWVHDYHLTMVPQMLRNVLPSAKIGFFLHLPFPSSEIYRILPCREAILEGILTSDLVGFQTYDYARHFLSTVESLLDANCSPQGIEHNGHFANVAICPVGIDPEAVVQLCKTPQVTSLMTRWAKQTRDKTMLLGVDSLDATKGLVHKFLALEEMFGMEPNLADRVNFVQVCFTGAQSRERKVLEGQLQQFVGRINSKLGSIDEAGPVQYFLDINLHELSALYSIADVLVITPIRDGMNIVPFEYVVSRECRQLPATVVLSEFAGCARSIGGAVLVNPWNTTELTEKMIGAINMEADERVIRHRNMSSYVNNFTATRWCTRFIDQLKDANEGPERTTARLLQKDHVVMSFTYSRWRLLLFNLEGVLSRHCALPELVHVPGDVIATLDALSKEHKNMVVVKSPRSRETLSRLLGHTNCVLAAEHGAFIRWGKHARWQSLLPNPDMSWTSDVEPLLQYYTERTPGAVMEARELGRAWHYRDCDLGHGAWQAKQLHVSLIQLSKRLPIHVYAGDKVLEIIPQALTDQVSRFLEIVVVRFRRLLRFKPVEGISHIHHNSLEEEKGVEAFSSVIAGVDMGDVEGYSSGESDSGGLTITPAFHMPEGQQQQQQQQLVTLKLPLLKLLDPEDSSPEPGADAADDAAGRAVGSVAEAAGNISSSNRNSHGAAGGWGEMVRLLYPSDKHQNHQHHEHHEQQDQQDQHVKPDARGRPRGGGDGGVGGSRSDRGARVNRARSSSYGGKGSAPREATEAKQRHRRNRSHSRDSTLSRSRSLSRVPSNFRPLLPPEGIFALDTAGLGEWETVRGAGPGVKSPGGWSTRTFETDSTDAEEAPVAEGDADIEFVLVIAGGHDLNDDCMFEAMTPPEFNLDGSVHGMEEFDVEEDAEGEGEGGRERTLSHSYSHGTRSAGGVGAGGASNGSDGGGSGSDSAVVSTTILDKRPKPTIAAISMMGSAMKINAQTITSLGGTAPTPTSPFDAVVAEMGTLHETSGNWEYHPTVPPPPIGSPQVRLDPRGSARTFLYASNSTVDQDNDSDGRDDNEDNDGNYDEAEESEDLEDHELLIDGRGEADGEVDGRDERAINIIIDGDDGNGNVVDDIDVDDGDGGGNGLGEPVTEDKNLTVAAAVEAGREVAVVAAVDGKSKKERGRRSRATITKKNLFKRLREAVPLFAELRTRSRSPSIHDDRAAVATVAAGGGGGTVSSVPPGASEVLMLLTAGVRSQSRVPSPAPPLTGGIHEALAQANAAAIAAGELALGSPSPVLSLEATLPLPHNSRHSLPRSYRETYRAQQLRATPPPPPPPPPPPLQGPYLRRRASSPALGSFDTPLPPTAGGGSDGGGIGLANRGGVVCEARSIMPATEESGRGDAVASGPSGASPLLCPAPGRAHGLVTSGWLGKREAASYDAINNGYSLQEAVRDTVRVDVDASHVDTETTGAIAPPSASDNASAPASAFAVTSAAFCTTSAAVVSTAEAPATSNVKAGAGGQGKVSALPPMPIPISISTPTLSDPPTAGTLLLRRDLSGSSTSGGASGSGAGHGGLVGPKKDRRQDASGQIKFIPRKDYPTTSVLYKAMRYHFGKEFASRDLPDTPAACWALVMSAQSPRGAPPPFAAAAMPQKPSARPRESTSNSGGATGVKVDSEGNSKASTPRRDDVGRSSTGTLETVRHAIALRQRAAEASADGSVAPEVEVKAVEAEQRVEHQALLDRGRGESPGVDSYGASLGQQDDAPHGGDGSKPSPESAEDDATAVAQDDGGRDVGNGDGDGGEGSGAVVEVGKGGGLKSGAAVAAAGRHAAVELALASAEVLPEVAAETARADVAALGPSGDKAREFVHQRHQQDQNQQRQQHRQQGQRSTWQSTVDGGGVGHGLDLPINTFSCTVGLKLSQANFYIKSSAHAAALCKELSQIKDKEYTTGLQEYEDDVGTHHSPQSFALLNRSTSKSPPHTASVSNMADLEIVMGSQFTEDSSSCSGSGTNLVGSGRSSLGLPRRDRHPHHDRNPHQLHPHSGRHYSRSSAGRAAGTGYSMGYNQNSAGWTHLAESIQHDAPAPGVSGEWDVDSADAKWGPSSGARRHGGVFGGERVGRSLSLGEVEGPMFASKTYRTTGVDRRDRGVSDAGGSGGGSIGGENRGGRATAAGDRPTKRGNRDQYGEKGPWLL